MKYQPNETNDVPGRHLMDISAYGIQGRRDHMEDFFDIGYQLKPPAQRRPNEWPYDYFYFAIFDGHGGTEAAKMAKKSLLEMIVRQKDFWSDDDDDVMRAITKGFADTHAKMREQLPDWARANKTLPSTAGTTASVLFIKNGKFYSGHVGDSRIVISRQHPETNQWISEQITEDHKPESETEIERIQRAGGDVKPRAGVHRVIWRRPIWKKDFYDKLNSDPKSEEYDECLKQIDTYPIEESLVEYYQTIPFLAIARSLGDFWSINPESGQYIISPEPDVMCRPIDKNDKCILLATDGMWNVISSSKAVRYLQELKITKEGQRDSKEHIGEYFSTDNFYDVSMPKDDKNYALSLVYIAYQHWERRRLRSDNITAVVAMLSDILPQAQSKTPERNPSEELPVDNVSSILYVTNSIEQLDQTHIFCESIFSDTKPKFYANPGSDSETEMWQKIEKHLVLPPTVFCNTRAYVTAPRNYERLSNAKCRRLVYDQDYFGEDMYIYVKSISDDPADEVQEPSRLNKHNKEVRNSTCQVFQPMNDFGQPWHQMLDEEEAENDYQEYEDLGYGLVLGDELKVAHILKESGRVLEVDERYLGDRRETRSSKKRRYDDDSDIMYGPHKTRSNQAHCV